MSVTLAAESVAAAFQANFSLLGTAPHSSFPNSPVCCAVPLFTNALLGMNLSFKETSVQMRTQGKNMGILLVAML